MVRDTKLVKFGRNRRTKISNYMFCSTRIVSSSLLLGHKDHETKTGCPKLEKINSKLLRAPPRNIVPIGTEMRQAKCKRPGKSKRRPSFFPQYPSIAPSNSFRPVPNLFSAKYEALGDGGEAICHGWAGTTAVPAVTRISRAVLLLLLVRMWGRFYYYMVNWRLHVRRERRTYTRSRKDGCGRKYICAHESEFLGGSAGVARKRVFQTASSSLN